MGTQCVTKHDHTKPKAGELTFHKGDVVTIIEAVEVTPWAVGWAVPPGPGPPSWWGVPFLRPSHPQGRSWYRARHNESGQEGLVATGALRERGAIRADPKLSLMP